MKLLIHSPAKSLNKAYLKQSIRRDQIDLFKSGLGRMFERIRPDEHEEHLKNIVSDFLKDTWYKQTNEINPLAIPPATDAQKALIIECVRKILAGPDSLANVETQNLASLQEAEIDRLVYALYGLTDEEIAVVEGKQLQEDLS